MPTFPDQPLYQKIKEDILRQIKDGQLLPGDKIPTEYQLMEKYGVSRITVSKALSELKSEGIITRDVYKRQVQIILVLPPCNTGHQMDHITLFPILPDPVRHSIVNSVNHDKVTL